MTEHNSLFIVSGEDFEKAYIEKVLQIKNPLESFQVKEDLEYFQKP